MSNTSIPGDFDAGRSSAGWTDAARAASLAVRRAKAAAREGSSGGAPRSSASGAGAARGGDVSASDLGPAGLASQVHVSGFSRNSRGVVSVGFTDSSVFPPVHRLIQTGCEDGGWMVKSTDYAAGTAVIEKDGKEFTVGVGGQSFDAVSGAKDYSERMAHETAADQAEHQDNGVMDAASAGIDAFQAKYGKRPTSEEECKEAAGLSGAATDSDLESVEEWIRERAADAADGRINDDQVKQASEAFEMANGRKPETDDEWIEASQLAGLPEDGHVIDGGSADVVSDNGTQDPAIYDRALEMFQGEPPDAEPPSFDDLTAVLNSDLENCNTSEARFAALSEYRASLAAGQMLWDRAADSAFEALNGHAPATDYERRAAYKLAGTPKAFLPDFDRGAAPVQNRRADRFDALCNRVDRAASRLLDNVGWTDAARGASLLVRQAMAAARRASGGTPPPGVRPPSVRPPFVVRPPSGVSIPPVSPDVAQDPNALPPSFKPGDPIAGLRVTTGRPGATGDHAEPVYDNVGGGGIQRRNDSLEQRPDGIYLYHNGKSYCVTKNPIAKLDDSGKMGNVPWMAGPDGKLPRDGVKLFGSDIRLYPHDNDQVTVVLPDGSCFRLDGLLNAPSMDDGMAPISHSSSASGVRNRRAFRDGFTRRWLTLNNRVESVVRARLCRG